MNFLKPEEYQSECELLFQEYRTVILDLLPGVIVEHIGSSAIPGAISKGDLDVFVGVEKSKFEVVVQKLKLLNFLESQTSLRSPELCMLDSQVEPNLALQVVALGSVYESFIEFRDILRLNPVLVAKYNNLKVSCIGMSAVDYREHKREFIEQVLESEHNQALQSNR